MNVEIAVGSIGVSFTAELVEPTATSRTLFIVDVNAVSTMTFSRSTIISLNGHSLSAINPDFKIGDKTMLIAA